MIREYLLLSFSLILAFRVKISSPEESKDVILAHEAHVEQPSSGMAKEDPNDLLAHDTNVVFDVEEERGVLKMIRFLGNVATTAVFGCSKRW
jgi:hypothetical protein